MTYAHVIDGSHVLAFTLGALLVGLAVSFIRGVEIARLERTITWLRRQAKREPQTGRGRRVGGTAA